MDTTLSTQDNSAAPSKPGVFKRLKNHKAAVPVAVLLVAAVIIGGGYYWYLLSSRIYTDRASIVAPLVYLSPTKPQILKKILVNDGDKVGINTPVARTDDDFIYTQTSGIVVGVSDQVGALFNPGTPVVTMVDPTELRLEAKIEENKGFSDIKIGQNVIFTVDAFGSREFNGVVDSIAKTSEDSSLAFSISDKREAKLFLVKVKYNINEYPELLNGMSAKVWIYK